MLKYDEVDVLLTTEAWQEYKQRAANMVSEDELQSFLLNAIKDQLNCLRYRAGVRFGRLPRLSSGGKNYSYTHVQRAYEVLLAKFTAGSFHPKPVVRGMEEVLMTASDAFRDGTMTAEAKLSMEETRKKYRKEIAECRDERTADRTRARTRCGRGAGTRRTRNRNRVH